MDRNLGDKGQYLDDGREETSRMATNPPINHLRENQMKSFSRVLGTAVLASLVGTIATHAHAGKNAIDGMILGAGSGALVGQVIGRDSEATLLGTAVGGLVGYVIGNAGQPTYIPPPPVISYPSNAPVYVPPPPRYRPLPPPPPIHRVYTRDFYRGPKICRETITERGFPGRIVRDISTSCWFRPDRPYWGKDHHRRDRYQDQPPYQEWYDRY